MLSPLRNRSDKPEHQPEFANPEEEEFSPRRSFPIPSQTRRVQLQ